MGDTLDLISLVIDQVDAEPLGELTRKHEIDKRCLRIIASVMSICTLAMVMMIRALPIRLDDPMRGAGYLSRTSS